jgi:hypothetical protein
LRIGCAKVVFFIYLCDAILALLLDCLFINYASAYEICNIPLCCLSL